MTAMITVVVAGSSVSCDSGSDKTQTSRQQADIVRVKAIKRLHGTEEQEENRLKYQVDVLAKKRLEETVEQWQIGLQQNREVTRKTRKEETEM